ncbi:MAG: glycosyltransferase family 9 protein [Verrucomicrobia bacterium]|nr:glycosyltransferase family 9 protein [Cytophagales bacterium]
MGDVALLLPVLKAIAEQQPTIEITLVTRKKFAVFFEGLKNIYVFEADFEGKHKDFAGLASLYQDLKNMAAYDCIVDVHQNLRSLVLKGLFMFSGVKNVTIDKGRAEKKALTRKKNKVLKPLKHTVERYQETLAEAGIVVNLPPEVLIQTQEINLLNPFFAENNLIFPKSGKWLGIAPFAQHSQKMWAFENFNLLLKQIYQAFPAIQVFLFGGGNAEIRQLESLQAAFPQVYIVAGKLNLSQELSLMKNLDLMLCMDSGNMHLASLCGVQTLSIWGATHQFAGFSPYGKNTVIEIPVEELTCRPCSVFGNKPCWRGDLACLTQISSEMVFEKLKILL